MNGKYKALYALMLLSLLVAGVFLAFLPDQVPMHYDINGAVDRYGSKYENLILPLMTVLMGVFFVALARLHARRGDGNGENIYLLSGLAVLVLFNGLTVFFLWKAAASAETAAALDPMKVLSIALGAFVAVLGSFMPKAKRNRTFGLRTKWSLKNDRVWAKCQRFGAVASYAAGGLMVVGGIFLSGLAAVAAMLIVTALFGAACALGSREICRRDGEA